MDLGRRLSPRARARSALVLGIAVAGTLAGGSLIGLSHDVLPFAGWPSLGSHGDVQQRLAAAPDLVRPAQPDDGGQVVGAPRGFAPLAGGAPLAAAPVRVTFHARARLSATTSTIGARTATHDRDSDNDGIPDSVEAPHGQQPAQRRLRRRRPARRLGAPAQPRSLQRAGRLRGPRRRRPQQRHRVQGGREPARPRLQPRRDAATATTTPTATASATRSSRTCRSIPRAAARPATRSPTPPRTPTATASPTRSRSASAPIRPSRTPTATACRTARPTATATASRTPRRSRCTSIPSAASRAPASPTRRSTATATASPTPPSS